jgi:hypothetical protein
LLTWTFKSLDLFVYFIYDNSLFLNMVGNVIVIDF